MTWIKGIDFRGTSNYVTDPANCTYSLAEVYPTTRNEVTFGWSGGAVQGADRNNTVDARVAGRCAVASGYNRSFRIDLPATGDYKIRLAIGDVGVGNGYVQIELRDNTTTFATLSNGGNPLTVGHLWDAQGTDFSSAANWVSGNQQITRTFVSQIFNIYCEAGSLPDSVRIAHVELEQVAGGVVVPVMMQYRMKQ